MMFLKPVASISFLVKRSVHPKDRARILASELQKAIERFVFNDQKPGTAVVNTKSFYDEQKKEYELHFDIHTFPKESWEIVMMEGIPNPMVNIDMTKKKADPQNKLRGLTFEQAFTFG